MTRSRNILLLLLCAGMASAQGNDHLRQAVRYETAGDAYNAALQYEQYLGIRKSTAKGFAPYSVAKTGASGKEQNGTQKTAIYAKLAACYFELHDYARAAAYYAQGGPLSDEHALRYAQSLRASGRREEAAATLQAVSTRAIAGPLQKRILLEAAVLTFNPQPDPLATVAKAACDINSGHGNYAAVQSGSVLFFTSSRADSTLNGKGPHRNHLYRIVGTDALLADPLPGSGIDQGLSSFTPDGRRVYFTAWSREGAKNSARIYTCTRGDGGWTAPVALNEKVNVPGSSSAQPCYSEQGGMGVLYFSSDRPGGQGGYDIWYAPVDASGVAGAAQVLDGHINTAGDEAAPFYHAPAQMLVFASDGRPGLGGFDLYLSKLAPGGFGAATNAGAPINSVKDDSYFFSASKDSALFRNAFLSSDRESDCCLEIFTIVKADPPRRDTPQVALPPAKDTVAQLPHSFPVILFEFDKADLQDAAKGPLDSLADYLLQHPDVRIRIGGYTDGKGGEDYNSRLSDRRARAVRDYLAAKGITSGRLWIRGFGECCPRAPESVNGHDDPEARSRNRRVEIRPDADPK
jgi:OmpA-OmpF porin, OOP family